MAEAEATAGEELANALEKGGSVVFADQAAKDAFIASVEDQAESILSTLDKQGFDISEGLRLNTSFEGSLSSDAAETVGRSLAETGDTTVNELFAKELGPASEQGLKTAGRFDAVRAESKAADEFVEGLSKDISEDGGVEKLKNSVNDKSRFAKAKQFLKDNKLLVIGGLTAGGLTVWLATGHSLSDLTRAIGKTIGKAAKGLFEALTYVFKAVTKAAGALLHDLLIYGGASLLGLVVIVVIVVVVKKQIEKRKGKA